VAERVRIWDGGERLQTRDGLERNETVHDIHPEIQDGFITLVQRKMGEHQNRETVWAHWHKKNVSDMPSIEKGVFIDPQDGGKSHGSSETPYDRHQTTRQKTNGVVRQGVLRLKMGVAQHTSSSYANVSRRRYH
jgi:hypothetical protein